jgi:hypothetical protein
LISFLFLRFVFPLKNIIAHALEIVKGEMAFLGAILGNSAKLVEVMGQQESVPFAPGTDERAATSMEAI